MDNSIVGVKRILSPAIFCDKNQDQVVSKVTKIFVNMARRVWYIKENKARKNKLLIAYQLVAYDFR